MSDELDEKSVSPDQIVVTNERDRDESKDDSVEGGREEVVLLDKRFDLVEREIRMRGLQEFFVLRRRWSWWIIVWLTGLIFFNSGLAIAVGLECLNFEKYEWFITAITVETFLQIVGMGYVAVRFLFKDPGK